MIYYIHSAARTGSTVLCRHFAHKYDAINFDEWLMEMHWTKDAEEMITYMRVNVNDEERPLRDVAKVPPYGWKPKEFPKHMKPEDIKDLFWFMHDVEKLPVALKEKSTYIENALYPKHNVVVKMMSKNRDHYLKHLEHKNIYNYRRNLLDAACSWIVGVYGLLDNIELGHMHWEKGEWEQMSVPLKKHDLTQDPKFYPHLEILMASHWVWFNKALADKDGEFLVYEDWVDQQETIFPDTPELPTIKTPVHYTEVLSESTIEAIDEKLKDMKGAYKDNGFV